ncbi:MAG: class I SAM-dependent methyltransferase [Lachnospirales bacterium]
MNIDWNSKDYKEQFSFVPEYGEDVISLITKEKGCSVIDLGCGNGTLTKKLYDLGYDVIGVDMSESMLSLAEKEYPNLKFIKGDALNFKVEKKVDVVFSNAVFHWIDSYNHEKMLSNIYNALNDNGELVCEFGGYGCAESVHETLENLFNKRNMEYKRTFYFPTIGEYTPILEKCGFKVEYAILFDRPTLQKSQEGLIDWINMFVKAPFENVDLKIKDEILQEAKAILKNKLFVNNKWYIDYVRIRIRARKIK